MGHHFLHYSRLHGLPPSKVGRADSLRLGGGAPKAPSDMLASDFNQVLRYRRIDHFANPLVF
jgi:hypothetical protein